MRVCGLHVSTCEGVGFTCGLHVSTCGLHVNTCEGVRFTCECM